jgi:hypothetical protein
MGNRITAQQHARVAVELAPGDLRYRSFLSRISQEGGEYRQNVNLQGLGGIGKLFAGICFANILCRLCLCFTH